MSQRLQRHDKSNCSAEFNPAPDTSANMKLDFSAVPIENEAYSGRPMTLLDPDPKGQLTAIMELALIETGGRSAREQWQHRQLRNLFEHARRRSAFWLSRIGGGSLSEIKLGSLPPLTRQDLQRQVASEGSLLTEKDGVATTPHQTSGSSGSPVRFFVSDSNGRYNFLRHLTQYFMEGRAFSPNRTQIRHASAPIANGVSVAFQPAWVGPLSPVIRSGVYRHIDYFGLHEKAVCDRLVQELKTTEIGYLVCLPRAMDTIYSSFGLDFLKEGKVTMWISSGEAIEPHLLRVFAELGIPIRQNYSCEEMGPVAAECDRRPGHFHVVTSNVVVEVVDQTQEMEGVMLGKVLVTHLHSYATPFIRYDLGDLASLLDKCPCGHDGPTLCHLHGRLINLVKHRDGRLSPLYISTKALTDRVNLTEFRMRQTAFEKFVVDIGGRSTLADAEVAAVTALVKDRVGQEFQIEVNACEQIDWGQSRKKYGFRCEI